MEGQGKITRWSKAVVTDGGIRLLTEFAAGRILDITNAFGSAGASGDNLAELENLPDGRAHPLVIESRIRTDEGVTVCIQVTSIGNPAPYKLERIGIYATTRDPGEEKAPEGGNIRGEKLLMVIEDPEDGDGGRGVTVPAETDQLYTFKLYAVLAITNKDRLEISVSSAGIATMGAIDDAIRRHNGDPEAHPGLRARMRAAEIALDGRETITGEGDPITGTEGSEGQRYINLLTGTEFICTGTEGGYTWEPAEEQLPIRDVLGAVQETAERAGEKAADAVKTAVQAMGVAQSAQATASEAKEIAQTAYGAITELSHTINLAPSQSGSLTYTGAEQSPVWNNYNPAVMTMGGAASGTDAGSYTATFTPKEDYHWSGGGTEAKSVTWTIGRAVISAVPSQSGTLTYNGKSQSPAWSNYSAEKLGVSGTTEAVNAGAYNAVFTPTANYCWADGTTAARGAAWSIGRAAVAVPSQKGSLAYTGAAQSPAWNNYDATKMTLGGTTSGTNAGTYTATFAPTSNYAWADGSTAAKTVAWTIGKAAGSLTLSRTGMTLGVSIMSSTISVTRPGNGAVSATSSNISVAMVNVSGTTVTVAAKAAGSATITVKVAADANHTAPANKTCSVVVRLPTVNLNDNSWAMIKEVSDVGQGANYWSVGDTKQIIINGEVGNSTFNNLAIDAFIIGFNHNASREGAGRIHFQIGKVDGKDVCLCDSKCGNSAKDQQGYFNMCPSNNTHGGWEGCYMRNDLLGNSGSPASPPEKSLLAALPADLRAVMKPVTKYSNNVGGKNGIGDIDADVTATTDYLFLLAEFEVWGEKKFANKAEKTYLLQYDYYKAGNTKVRYNHGDTGKAVLQWMRSIQTNVTVAAYFCALSMTGSATGNNACYCYGIAPCYTV